MQARIRDYRVLIADDDRSCRDSLVSLLAQEGFQSVAVTGGEEVLLQLRTFHLPARSSFDFLVLDYNMPDLTGLDVLRRLRIELRIQVPSILVSGESSQELERRVRDEGGFALVRKPVQPDPFRRLIWQLVESRLVDRSGGTLTARGEGPVSGDDVDSSNS